MTETCRLEGGRSQVEPPRGQAGGDSVHKEATLVLPIVGIPRERLFFSRETIHWAS